MPSPQPSRRRAAAAIAFALPCLLCWAGKAPAGQRADPPWHFSENFGSGIPAWMSFPLAQDVGYDPSIHTEPMDGGRALVRDVIAEGQTELRVGVLKPLRFHITPTSVLRLSYEVKMDGAPGPAELIVGAESGRKYSAALPAEDGAHQIVVRGTTLGVPAQGDDAAVLVIECKTTHPTIGSHNRLILRSMVIDAESQAEVPVSFPHLIRSSGMRTPVADLIVEASSPVLPLEVSTSARALEVTLYDGSGRRIKTAVLHGAKIGLGPSPSPGLWRAHLSTGSAQSDFRFLVLNRVPAHPRLLLTPERVEQLRSGPASDVLRNLIREKAAAAAATISYNPQAGDSIRLMSPDSVLPGLPNYFLLLTQYGDAIELNALDYRLRGSRESLEAARRALLAVSQWTTWTPTWFQTHGLHTYYEVGVFTQQCAFGYDLIANQLTAPDKARIADGFFRNAIDPAVEEYYLNDRLPIAASNHMAHAVGGAIAACIALYGDVADWDARFGPALAELIASYEKLLQGLFPGDGSEAEPAGYEDFAMEGMSFGMASLQRIGIRPPLSRRLLDSFWWPYYVQFKPGLMLDTGDWDGELSALSGYAWAAEESGDPTLRAFYDSAITHSLKSVLAAAHKHTAIPYAPGMLDLVCCTRPARPVPSAPPSRLFPLRGSAALRSGWDPNATLVSIRVGPWFNHEHHDEGSFQVAAFGEELIAEAGYSSYYTDPRYADYFTQVPGHNTVMLDGDPFCQNSYQGRAWPGFRQAPAITRHVLGRNIDYLSADLTSAYPSELKSFVREFVFLKPGVLAVHDSIRSSVPHRYSFLLHVPAGASAGAEGNQATIRAAHATAFAIAANESMHWSMTPQPIPVTAYRNFDRDPVQPRFSFTLSTVGMADATFTVGLQFLPSNTAKVSLHPISTANAEGFSTGAAHDRSLVLFRNAHGALAYLQHSTDGDLLASTEQNGQRGWFAGGARTLRDGSRAVFSAEEPVDAEWIPEADGETIRIFTAQPTTITFHARRTIRQLSLDLQPPAPTNHGLTVQLQFQPGEHRVHLAY